MCLDQALLSTQTMGTHSKLLLGIPVHYTCQLSFQGGDLTAARFLGKAPCCCKINPDIFSPESSDTSSVSIVSAMMWQTRTAARNSGTQMLWSLPGAKVSFHLIRTSVAAFTMTLSLSGELVSFCDIYIFI